MTKFTPEEVGLLNSVLEYVITENKGMDHFIVIQELDRLRQQGPDDEDPFVNGMISDLMEKIELMPHENYTQLLYMRPVYSFMEY